MRKILFVAMLAGVSLATHAKDEVVGSLSGVKGPVTITGESFVTKAGNGSPVLAGSKVLVSTNGRATVEFKDGCRVTLAGGQHLTVDKSLNCAQQQAAVQQLFKPYRTALDRTQLFYYVGTGEHIFGPGVGFAIGAGVIGMGALIANDSKVSGS